VFTDSDTLSISKSIIQDDEKDSYFEKAKHYYKQHDYSACANFLRKAFEEKVKALLPPNLLRHVSEDGTIKPNDKFVTNFNNFLQYLKDCNLDPSVFDDYKLYSKVILNPLSHDNAGSPVFRREVNAIFGILSEFDKIKNNLLIDISKNSNFLKFSIKDKSDNWYIYKIELRENLRLIKQGEVKKYAPCKAQIVSLKEGQNDWIDYIEPMVGELRTLYELKCNAHNVELKTFDEMLKNSKGVTILDMSRLNS
jgi:hypothetical protein